MERVGNTASAIDLSNRAAVYATTPSEHVSSKYTMASTKDIVDIFDAHGWTPVQYSEKRARIPERYGKQTHSIVLSNDSLNSALAVGSTLPRIVLKNSHDGGSSLQLLSGLYERICANGLIVGTSASDIRVRHVGLTEDMIVNGAKQCIESLQRALETSERMKAISLDNGQRMELAKQVIDMAWDGSQYSILPDSVLWNHRRDQRTPSLWNTFNTIQEHVIRGGVTQYREDGSRIRSREVRSIDRAIDLNRKMWDIAEARMAMWA